MRIYDMRCTHEMCGRVFDWHTKAAIYEKSRQDGFREVHCWHCGRLGAQRAFTSAPADLTVKGTWGRTASPELKGKSYYTRQERDRQLAAAGTDVIDSGESRGVLKKSDRITPSKRDAAREAITALLSQHGEMRLKDIISNTGLSSSAINDVIYKDPGRIQKIGRGLYSLTGAVAQTSSASS